MQMWMWSITNCDNWGPSTFSFFPSYLVSEPNPNVGVSPIIITSDPLRGLDLSSSGAFTNDEVEMAKSRIRRKVMSEFTNEYATLNRELLRDLAR